MAVVCTVRRLRKQVVPSVGEEEDGDSVFSHELGVTVSNATYDTTTATDFTTTESPPQVPPAESRDTVIEVLTSLLDKMELLYSTV